MDTAGQGWSEPPVLDVVLTDVDPVLAQRVPLRLDCYLWPHWPRFAAGLELALGVVLPPRIEIGFTGSAALVRDPARWQCYLPHGDANGVRTVERILVQVAMAATGGTAADAAAAGLHAATCPLIVRHIDLTFVCALETL